MLGGVMDLDWQALLATLPFGAVAAVYLSRAISQLLRSRWAHRRLRTTAATDDAPGAEQSFSREL